MKPIDGLKQTGPKSKTITLPMHDVFAKASEGPFRCGNCEYYKHSKCTQDYIVKHHGPDVEPGDCCDFFEKDAD